MCGGGRRSTAICYEAQPAPGRIPAPTAAYCTSLPLWIQVLYVWSGMSSSSAGGGAMAAARDRAPRYNPTSECNQYPTSERSQYLSSERTYPQQQHKGFNPGFDDTLAFPIQIALPDGEEAQNPTSTSHKSHRTQEQEEELKRPYIKPPPNRNFYDIGQGGPGPTRPSSMGVGLPEMRNFPNIQNVGSSREKEKEYRHSAPLESRPTSLWSGDDGGRSSPKRGRKPTRNIKDICLAPFTSPKCDRGVPHLSSQMEPGGGLTFRSKGIPRHHNQSETAPGTGSSISFPSSSSPPPDVNSPLLVHSGVSRLEEIPVLSCNPHANTSIPRQCYQQSSHCYQHYGMGSSGNSGSSFTEDLQGNAADSTDDRGANSASTGVTHIDRTSTHLTQQIDIYEHTSHCISDDTISEHDPPPLYYEVIEHPSLYRNVSSSRNSRQSEQRTRSGKI